MLFVLTTTDCMEYLCFPENNVENNVRANTIVGVVVVGHVFVSLFLSCRLFQVSCPARSEHHSLASASKRHTERRRRWRKDVRLVRVRSTVTRSMVQLFVVCLVFSWTKNVFTYTSICHRKVSFRMHRSRQRVLKRTTTTGVASRCCPLQVQLLRVFRLRKHPAVICTTYICEHALK